MKLNASAFANAAAVVDAMGHLLFGLLEAAQPGIVALWMSRWVQGVAFQRAPHALGRGFILGWISEVLLTWIAVYLVAAIYNELVGKKSR